MAEEDFHTLMNASPSLTNEALSKALTDWFKTELVFTHWEYVGETGKGDSYMSELMKIKIFGKSKDGGSKHIQVLLKTMPKSIARRLTFRNSHFFENEINFYNHVLPELLKFQATKNLSDPFTNYAKLFYSFSDGENDCIILEDITIENFEAAFRQKGIDINHCQVTMKTLAKYHAISFALRDQQPEIYKRITSKLDEKYYKPEFFDWYEKFWALLCIVAIDAVEKEYPNSICVQRVKEFAVPEKYKDMCAAVKDTWDTGVVSHGDSWTNNFMYKYMGERKPVDAKMVDFQLARSASPVLDLSFFIYACTTKDLRDELYDDLLQYYYDFLSKQIRELGSDPEKVYPRETFMKEVKKYFFFGLGFSFEAVPFIILDPEDALNMEIEGDKAYNVCEIWNIKPIKNKEGRRRLADIIAHAVDYGYI